METSTIISLTEIYRWFSLENVCTLHGVSWYSMVYHGLHGIPWCFRGFPDEFSTECLASLGVPWDSHGKSMVTMVWNFHRMLSG